MLSRKGISKPFWAVQLIAWPTCGLISFLASFLGVGILPLALVFQSV